MKHAKLNFSSLVYFTNLAHSILISGEVGIVLLGYSRRRNGAEVKALLKVPLLLILKCTPLISRTYDMIERITIY